MQHTETESGEIARFVKSLLQVVTLAHATAALAQPRLRNSACAGSIVHGCACDARHGCAKFLPTHPPYPCGAERDSRGTYGNKGITQYSRKQRPRLRCCSANMTRILSTICRCSLRTGSLRHCRTNKRPRPGAPDPTPGAATRGDMARAGSGTGEGNEALQTV